MKSLRSDRWRMVGGTKRASKQRRIWSLDGGLALFWIHFGSSSNDDQKKDCLLRFAWPLTMRMRTCVSEQHQLIPPLSLKALKRLALRRREGWHRPGSQSFSFHRPRSSLRTLVICYVFISLSSVYILLKDRNLWGDVVAAVVENFAGWSITSDTIFCSYFIKCMTMTK